MLTADARQQGGHPTCSDHTFTYEATVEDGEVTLFRRTGQYPYEFCPDGYRIVDSILSRDGTPADGLYTFSIQRDHSASVTFQAPDAETEEYYPHVAKNFEGGLARRDIKWLDKGLARAQDMIGLVTVEDTITYLFREHLKRHPLGDVPFPAASKLQLLANTMMNLTQMNDRGQGHAFMTGDGEFMMVIDGNEIHVAYTGIYQPWAIVFAQWMVSHIREHLDTAYRTAALHLTGVNLARIQRAEAANILLCPFLEGVGDKEIQVATAQAQHTYLELRASTETPMRTRLPGMGLGRGLQMLFARALGALGPQVRFTRDPGHLHEGGEGFTFKGGPDLSGLGDPR